MTHQALAALEGRLAALARDGLERRRRHVESAQGAVIVESGRPLVNFASNDYLGLASHPRIRAAASGAIERYGFGAGASPVVVGHAAPHDQAETAFARFVGLPRALLFASGYAANLGILTALADRGCAIFADKLNHACLNDGALLSRADFKRYPHGDLAALDSLLRASASRTRLIATDAVFSMDGDIAPAAQLLELAERHDAWLVLDDAHGIGVIGGGRGILAHAGGLRSPRVVYMATLGKALGGYGAFVAGAPAVIDWLEQKARTYVFSTALPPAAAAAACEAIAMLEEDGGLTSALGANIAAFRAAMAQGGMPTASTTAIQPVIVGGAARAVALSARLQERGLLVPAIRPPTVPEGTSRLRVGLSAAHTREHVETLARALLDELADAPR